MPPPSKWISAMSYDDVRDAVRSLVARPVQSILVVCILGIGIGVVLFTLNLINAMILRPLPYPDESRLVAVGGERESGVGIGGMRSADFRRLDAELDAIQSWGVHTELPVSLGHAGSVTRVQGAAVSAQVFDVLQVAPALGRSFRADEDRHAAGLTVVISDRLWRNLFAARQDVLGSALRVNGENASIIGVMPPGFGFPEVADVWLPARLDPNDSDGVDVVARLKPGIDVQQASQQLQAVSTRLGDELEISRQKREYIAKPLAYRFVDEATRAYLYLMLGASLIVLILACANVSNLFLIQAIGRSGEFALRSTLGATRMQIFWRQLVECTLVSLIATLVALAIAQLGVQWVVGAFARAGSPPPTSLHIGLDVRVLLLAMVMAVMATLLAGLLPARRASGVNLQRVLRQGEAASGGARLGRVSSALVVAEVALTVLLLVAAGVFIHNLQKMAERDLGTRVPADQITLAQVQLHPERFTDADALVQVLNRLGQELKAEPGFATVSLADAVPGVYAGSSERIAAQGRAEPASGYPNTQVGAVDGDFLAHYGIALKSGRAFGPGDRRDTLPVAIVDDRLAALLWPNEDPLGKVLVMNADRDGSERRRVVGLVGPVHLAPAGAAPAPAVLVPISQRPPNALYMAVRATEGSHGMEPRLHALALRAHPDVELSEVRTHALAVEMSRTGDRVLTQIFTALGAVALILAASGLYGVMAYTTRMRVREIGVRRAIGAPSWRIALDVLKRVGWQLGIGVAIGVSLAVPWTLPLVEANGSGDLPVGVFIWSLLILMLVTLLAALLPIQRALRVQPVEALRHG